MTVVRRGSSFMPALILGMNRAATIEILATTFNTGTSTEDTGIFPTANRSMNLAKIHGQPTPGSQFGASSRVAQTQSKAACSHRRFMVDYWDAQHCTRLVAGELQAGLQADVVRAGARRQVLGFHPHGYVTRQTGSSSNDNQGRRAGLTNSHVGSGELDATASIVIL